jgi:hypothetical protein
LAATVCNFHKEISMSIFDRLDRIVSNTVDRTMSESFLLTPMKPRANGRSEQDADRDVVQARGIYSTTPSPAGVQIGERKPSPENNDLRALVRGNEVYLSCERSQFPDMPRQGDMVSWPNRTDRKQMMVSSVRPDGLSRVELVLTA